MLSRDTKNGHPPTEDIHSLKQGYKDSNLEMTESESVALPFGDSPMYYFFTSLSTQNELYTNLQKNASTFFNFFNFFDLSCFFKFFMLIHRKCDIVLRNTIT